MTDGITGAKRAFLIGLREDGSPTCHPMTAVMRDDKPSFNSYRKSVKVRNFLRDPRAALVLLEDWQTSPSTADIRKGKIVETPPLAPASVEGENAASELQSVPDSVKQRVRRRVDSGKRIYFSLESDH